jgi:hypothetical protein
MNRKTCAKFVSLKALYPLIRRTCVPNLGRLIIYPESTKNSYRIKKIYKHKERTKMYLSLIRRVVKSRRIRWAGHVARMGEERGVDRVLVGKPEGKRPLGRPRRRWENIKMDLQEVGGGGGDWMKLA